MKHGYRQLKALVDARRTNTAYKDEVAIWALRNYTERSVQFSASLF
jgi:hypothetical protein